MTETIDVFDDPLGTALLMVGIRYGVEYRGYIKSLMLALAAAHSQRYDNFVIRRSLQMELDPIVRMRGGYLYLTIGHNIEFTKLHTGLVSRIIDSNIYDDVFRNSYDLHDFIAGAMLITELAETMKKLENISAVPLFSCMDLD